jgi:hypothetical protein
MEPMEQPEIRPKLQLPSIHSLLAGSEVDGARIDFVPLEPYQFDQRQRLPEFDVAILER